LFSLVEPQTGEAATKKSEKAMFKKARAPTMLLGLLVLSGGAGMTMASFTNAETVSAPAKDSTERVESLKISAFRDISAFILDLLESQTGFPFEVKYVKNADEAHNDLKQGLADIVFMSYDDTLSIALQDGYSDVAAVMPIHGGILDLCGALEAAAPRVGIDTDTGYARALRKFLLTELGPVRYSEIAWIKAGATDLRYQQLLDGQLDATLLNPPFSYRSGINRITALTGNDVIPTYQGVVANINRSWLQTPGKTRLLASFIAVYRDTIAFMQSQPDGTIARLVSFYQVSEAEATAIYGRLWAADGLSRTTAFDPAALAGTERIFAFDSGITVPGIRTWIMDWDATNK
jgi:predicted ribosomally synthesized peptide with SipW-like signal peptide